MDDIEQETCLALLDTCDLANELLVDLCNVDDREKVALIEGLVCSIKSLVNELIHQSERIAETHG